MKTRNASSRWLWIIALTLSVLSHEAAAQDEVNTGYFGNVAIKGYDPVSYFTPGAAERGSPEYALDWLGASWHFVSEEHKQAFEADPIRYAPQYGGYCAVGMAEDTLTRDIDPEAFIIIDGKLYLNYSTEVGGLL
ncbi:MAG TPA: YHS domain-containing (seleno)protein, partial [Gammaproteobacteria bacterium]